MPGKQMSFRCYHPDCAGDPPTELMIDVPRRPAVGAGRKEKVVYCNRNHLNVITLPDTWNVQSLVLGDDIVGFQGDVPVLQGKQG